MVDESKEINGIPYYRVVGFDDPADDEKIWKPEGDTTHPYVCDCGSVAFEIFSPYPYYTHARCRSCGHSEAVHTG